MVWGGGQKGVAVEATLDAWNSKRGAAVLTASYVLWRVSQRPRGTGAVKNHENALTPLAARSRLPTRDTSAGHLWGQ